MIIIHRVSHNADYHDVLSYYTYQHKEEITTGHYEPVLDKHGLLQPRENCMTIYINAQGHDDDPQRFVVDCLLTNRKYGKNRDYSDVKSHEYIISHDASDRPKMSMQDLEKEARAWAAQYGKGYQVLISIHRDTDNDHIHITINSLRAESRSPQPWMKTGKNGHVLPCEVMAGGKHQQSTALRVHMNDWALEYATQHGLLAEDNNEKARNATQKRFDVRNAFLRAAAITCASTSTNIDQFSQSLLDSYGITLIRRGQTTSLLYPWARKATRLRSLALTSEELSSLLDLDFTLTQEEEERIKKERQEREKARSQGNAQYYNPHFTNTRTGRVYCCSYYDETGRARTGLELIYVLALVVLDREAYLWVPHGAVPQDQENEVFFAFTNKKIQAMVDACELAQKMDIDSPIELDSHVRQAEATCGRLKRACAATRDAVSRMAPITQAIAVYKCLHDTVEAIQLMPEGKEKTALLQLHASDISKLTATQDFLRKQLLVSNEDFDLFEQRYKYLLQDIADLESRSQEATARYRELKNLQYQLQLAQDPRHLYPQPPKTPSLSQKIAAAEDVSRSQSTALERLKEKASSFEH